MIFEQMAMLLTSVFKPTTRESELEKYLATKRPQTAADVEFYIKEFDRQSGGTAAWWIR